MSQRVPDATDTDVDRILHRDFAEVDRDAASALLSEYGQESYHQEYARVRLAILKLSEGDLDKLKSFVRTAKEDSRDVLA